VAFSYFIDGEAITKGPTKKGSREILVPIFPVSTEGPLQLTSARLPVLTARLRLEMSSDGNNLTLNLVH
jgi:hypothetical protein